MDNDPRSLLDKSPEVNMLMGVEMNKAMYFQKNLVNLYNISELKLTPTHLDLLSNREPTGVTGERVLTSRQRLRAPLWGWVCWW